MRKPQNSSLGTVMSWAELAEKQSGGQELKTQCGWLLLSHAPGPDLGGHPKPGRGCLRCAEVQAAGVPYLCGADALWVGILGVAVPPGSLPYQSTTPCLCHPRSHKQSSWPLSIVLGAMFFLYIYTHARIYVFIYINKQLLF